MNNYQQRYDQSPSFPTPRQHNERREVFSPDQATCVYGGDRSSAMPVSSMTASHTGTVNLPIPNPDQRASRWSESVQSLLDQPPAALPQRFIIGGIAFCLAFGTWAWFGTVEEVGKAVGKLVPEGETFKIEPTELGQVKQVLVKEGQEVRNGQLLVELDNELAEKEVERLQQMTRSYQIEFTQKQALRDRVELEAKTQAAIASAQLLAQQSAISLAMQKKTTISRLLEQQRIEAAAYRARQAQRQPLSAMAQKRLKQFQAEKAARQQRLERLRPLEEDGAISKEFIFKAEQELREIEQRITASQLQEVTNASEQLFQANQSLRDLDTKTTQSQGDLLTANQEVEQARAQLVAQQAEAQKIQLDSLQKLQQLDIEITQLLAKNSETKKLLLSAKTKFQDKFLRSPIPGIIFSLNFKNSGEVVEPGETVAEIAPHNAPLVVSAVLPNKEAGFVEPGMSAKVKLEAYPYQDYGVIPGRVTRISTDAESNEELGEVYRVEISLERDHITDNQKVIPFKPGQTLSADIIIRRRRIIDVMLDPIKQVQKDGIKL